MRLSAWNRAKPLAAQQNFEQPTVIPQQQVKQTIVRQSEQDPAAARQLAVQKVQVKQPTAGKQLAALKEQVMLIADHRKIFH